ncbi:MAG: hypothetical protein DI536_11095 [Archangium gephyra]|uniref:Uncharacterized protein n=1 Tax=Archangium gephyra TaxID=48 RepID=A0A2W5TEB2_9BACT|nr:MAG: hypothetical protein DI536_11095 [Archangium gephyra]
MAQTLSVTWPSIDALQQVLDTEIRRGGLLVRGATAAGATVGADVQLEARVADGAAVVVPARIAAAIPGVGVAVLFNGVPPQLEELAMPVLDAEADEERQRPPAALSERLKSMTVTEKMQLAMQGTRDERAALLRDVNKTLHVYVLKNPRIGLDEVQSAAKNPQLGPDAIKLIAEHREWGSNPTVCAALVRNPRTPVPMALKMMDKVPMTDIRALAKGGAREAIVHAARKRLEHG